MPNTYFAKEQIPDIKEMEDGRAEIILKTKTSEAFETGTKFRIHVGSSRYIDTNSITLAPGEEIILSCRISKEIIISNTMSMPFRGKYTM